MTEINTLKESSSIDLDKVNFSVLHWSYCSEVINVNHSPVKSFYHQTEKFNIYKFHKPISRCFNLDYAYLDEK